MKLQAVMGPRGVREVVSGDAQMRFYGEIQQCMAKKRDRRWEVVDGCGRQRQLMAVSSKMVSLSSAPLVHVLVAVASATHIDSVLALSHWWSQVKRSVRRGG